MKQHIPSNRNYYDKRFGTLSQQLNEEETRRWQTIKRYIDALHLSTESSIADFGCGRGWLTQQLNAYGSATGFDLSEKAIDNAKKSFTSCRFYALNAEEELPLEFHNRFDLVVSSEVIEHTEAQKKYLQNSLLLLKPDGMLLITTPNGKWKKDFYQNGRELWKQPIENWLSQNDLKQLLTELGLEIIKCGTFNAEWLFDFRPNIGLEKIMAIPLFRKMLKLTGLYEPLIKQLNKNNVGLNLIFLAKKQ